MPLGFWDDPGDARYHAAYFERFPGAWHQGDFAEWTEHGGVVIHGRSDATLNPGGVRIGTAEIYRQVDSLDDVLESLVIGQEWDGDVRVVLFVVLRDGVGAHRRAQGHDPRSDPIGCLAAPRAGPDHRGHRPAADPQRQAQRARRPRRRARPDASRTSRPSRTPSRSSSSPRSSELAR